MILSTTMGTVGREMSNMPLTTMCLSDLIERKVVEVTVSTGSSFKKNSTLTLLYRSNPVLGLDENALDFGQACIALNLPMLLNLG